MSRIIIQPQSDENLRDLIGLALENQLRFLRLGINKTRRKLQEMESENEMRSDKFYKKYEKGELGDDLKYIRWAGEYETLKKLEKDYKALQETELCS